MKVFLCWSGNESRRVAQVFHHWLPLFLQNVQPFMSTGDIDKGAHWGTALQKELKGAVYGIIFVTRYSYKEPWINFEAGAISNTLDSSSVSPFLIQVTDEDIKGPLEQFESTKFEENDIYRLLNSINKNLGNIGRDISPEMLHTIFDKWWGEFNGCLSKTITGKAEWQSSTGRDWLLTESDFMSRQESIECKTIWVVTPDPTTRASAANAHKIVEGKLKQKVEYTFIIPASKENAFSRFLSSYFSDYHDQISITSIDDKEYDTLAATTYVLIDTFSKNEKVYFEIPVKPSDNWIEVEDFAAHKFALRFQEYAKKAHKLNC